MQEIGIREHGERPQPQHRRRRADEEQRVVTLLVLSHLGVVPSLRPVDTTAPVSPATSLLFGDPPDGH